MSGTVLFSLGIEFLVDVRCGPSQGVFAQSGVREFTTTHKQFCYIASDDLFFTLVYRDVIRLNRQGTTFTGTQDYEAFDVDGVSLGASQAKLEGTRLQVQAADSTKLSSNPTLDPRLSRARPASFK